MRQFRLYYYTGNHRTKVYRADRPTSLPNLAHIYDESDVIDQLLRGEYFLELAEDSPPPLGIHVTDGIGSKDKLR